MKQMDSNQLKKLSYTDLKTIAGEMDIEIPKTKNELIEIMIECFKKWENYKKGLEKYKKIIQIRNKGKEGVTFLVETPEGVRYAMKSFKKNKSSDKLRLEARLQQLAAEEGISPKVVDVDTVSKFIVMEKLDKHLIDVMKSQGGNLTETQQKQIFKIYKALDKAKVFHGDSNILNYMYKNRKLYIIDFGMSREIDDKLINKLKTSTPNVELMNLGFVLKLKELNCPETAYSYLLAQISQENKIRYGL